MSSQILSRAFRASIASPMVPMRRSIATTPQFRHKESSQHDNNHGEDISRHKDELVNKHKQGDKSANWKSELASDSEEAVKADRDESGSIKDLQERTKGQPSKA